MKETLIKNIRNKLRDSSDVKTLESSKRFFKKGEEARVYGVRMGEVSKIGKALSKQLKEYPKDVVFDICEELWQSRYLEEAVIACILSESLHKQYEPADIKIFEHWIKHYVNNWADCDTFCNHTVGSFIMKYPEYINKLKLWAKSPGRWLKRASAVSLIVPARRGLFLNDIFEIADILLTDRDDMVQKGYGWMLKVAADAHRKEVFDYVMSKKAIMPRTALRYAIEKMPEEMRKQAMEK